MKRIRLRPLPGGRPDAIELRNIESGKSFSVNAISAARAIIKNESLVLDHPGPKRLIGFDVWINNGWDDSIDFYLSTLDRNYADASENFHSSQRAILSKYNTESTIPEEQIPESIEWTPLPPYTEALPINKHDILISRRTTLVPKRAPIGLAELANILWEASRRLAAFRHPRIAANPQHALVNFGPSLDIFLAIYDIVELVPGIYRYDMVGHRLGLVKQGDFRSDMRTVIVGQPASESASVSVLYVSDIFRHQWRYRHERALRGLWIDSAKVVNELLWSLAARRIIPHMTPAVNDDAAAELLRLEKNINFEVLYVISFAGRSQG